MIITKDEYIEMGFSLDDQSEPLLEGCIRRAGFVLNGLTNGRAGVIAKGEGEAAELVKEAAAFQTFELLKEEVADLQARLNSSESGSSAQSSQSDEKISIGDFSYSTGTSSSKSTSSSTKSETLDVKRLDVGKTVIRLLRASGCLFGGMEARE